MILPTHPSRLVTAVAGVAIAVASLAGCSDDPTAVAPPPAVATCITGLSSAATCYAGEQLSGATYQIAFPTNWNGILIVVARGATPVPATELRTFGGTRNLLRDGGLALAATTYRSETPLARDAADDVEELRQIFVRRFGRPKHTIVWGLSFGGLVAARCAERFQTFDGVVSLCGLVAGTLRSLYTQLDVRTVVQHYCRNLPRDGEASYALFLGLPPASTITAEEVQARVNECTGILLPAAQRSVQQRANLANILGVLRIPESGLSANMDAATTLLKTFVQGTLGGHNPLQNANVRYTGSTDDVALNRDVARYTAEAATANMLASADDPTGRVNAPVVTLHAIDDPRAFVENQSAYRATLTKAGTLGNLFQAFTNLGGHCTFTTAEQLGTLQVLLDWLDTKTPPTQASLAAACEKYRTEFGTSCRFNAAFQPASLDTRLYPR
jgi:pimeloyl-ACP methyl ester carboxylesterase